LTKFRPVWTEARCPCETGIGGAEIVPESFTCNPFIPLDGLMLLG
jgi:hypothetical protein